LRKGRRGGDEICIERAVFGDGGGKELVVKSPGVRWMEFKRRSDAAQRIKGQRWGNDRYYSVSG
jgi:hypothetical protein